MDDLISRQALCEYALNQKDKSVTPNDIMRFPSAQSDLDEWCPDCKEYDSKRHCCPRFNRVIREALKEVQTEKKKGRWIDNGLGLPRCSQCGGKTYGYHFADCIKSDFCPHCGADMREGR